MKKTDEEPKKREHVIYHWDAGKLGQMTKYHASDTCRFLWRANRVPWKPNKWRSWSNDQIGSHRLDERWWYGSHGPGLDHVVHPLTCHGWPSPWSTMMHARTHTHT